MLERIILKNIGAFASGVIVGTAGSKVLNSKDAKKVYANVVAAGLRAKDEVVTTTKKVQEGVEDIFEEAKEINRARKEKEEEKKDSSDKETEQEEDVVVKEEQEHSEQSEQEKESL